MPRTLTTGKYPCPLCDAEPFRTVQARGAHKRYVHGNGYRKPKAAECDEPTRLPTTRQPSPKPSPVPIVSAPPVESTPVPVACATCFHRATDVEKGLFVVLVRAGMSIERAQRTLQEMRGILRRNGHGTN